MVVSFACAKTEDLFSRRVPREFRSIALVARKRLVALNGATRLTDLLIPPGHRLEALKGNRKGQHSIRINDQYRLCFTWAEGNAENVEITKHYK